MSDDIRVPRFYIQHGVIHDNVTGKHVTCDPDTRTLEGCGPNGEDVVHKNPDGITSTLDLLNGLCRHETSELAASLITCAESRCECCDGWLDEAERLMREAAAALLAAPPAAQPDSEYTQTLIDKGYTTESVRFYEKSPLDFNPPQPDSAQEAVTEIMPDAAWLQAFNEQIAEMGGQGLYEEEFERIKKRAHELSGQPVDAQGGKKE